MDKNATQMRRLSQTEDDNPPSPVADSLETYLLSGGMKTASPSIADANSSISSTVPGVRTGHHATVGPSLGSNPNTPASPHTTMLSQVV